VENHEAKQLLREKGVEISLEECRQYVDIAIALGYLANRQEPEEVPAEITGG